MRTQRKITVLNRLSAIQYCQKQHTAPAIMISISTPDIIYKQKPYISQENRLLAIVTLSFDDADSGDSAMTKGDAQKIKKCVNRYPDCDIIVHCDAGTSRSAGVAAALAKYFNGSGETFFNSRQYHPNMRCYRVTLETMQPRLGFHSIKPIPKGSAS